MPHTVNPIHVLLLEDDPDYVKLVRLKLERAGFVKFKIDSAESLEEFQEKLAHLAPDVIVSDLGLPESIGLETFKKVQAIAQDLPIIVLTGLDDGEAGIEAVQLGAQDYLVKNEMAGDLIAHSIVHAIERNRLRLELKEANERLALQAVTDPLTSLLNRRGFEQVFVRETAYKKRYGTEFFLVMIDLDDFKSINERFGHSAGDLALQQIASRIKSAIRPTDYAARIGGDEFLVLLVQTQNESALKVAERLRQAIGDAAISVQGQGEVHVTASAGLIDLGDDDIQLDKIIQRADRLLRKSKSTGKNRVSSGPV